MSACLLGAVTDVGDARAIAVCGEVVVDLSQGDLAEERKGVLRRRPADDAEDNLKGARGDRFLGLRELIVGEKTLVELLAESGVSEEGAGGDESLAEKV